MATGAGEKCLEEAAAWGEAPEYMDDMVFCHDPGGTLLSVSSSIERTLGYTADEVLGRRFYDLIAPEFREEALRRVERQSKGEEIGPPWDLQFVDKQGVTKWVQIRTKPIYDREGRLEKVCGAARDIADRKILEQKLRDCAARLEQQINKPGERFRELAEMLPETIFEIDVSGRLTFVNKSAQDSFGYSKEDFVRGLKAFDVVAPVDRARVIKNAKRIMAGEALGQNEYLMLRKDGSTFEGLFHSSPIIQEGKTIGIRGFIIDISERKRIEEALRQSEEKYRQLVEHAPAGIYEVDFAKGNLVSVNDLMCHYTGYSKEELLSMNILDILDDDGKRRFLDRVRKLYRGEELPETVEYKIKTKQGGEMWVSLRARFKYKDNVPVGANVIVHNITERKLAERELARSEEKYRLLVDTAAEGICIIVGDRIEFANERLAKMAGYSKEELKTVSLENLIYSEDLERVMKGHRSVLSGESPPAERKFRVVKKDGAMRWAHTKTLLIDWDGQPATMNLFTDVTEAMLAENALRASEKQYRELVENISVGIIIGDTTSGRLIYANPRAFDMLGYELDEISGLTICDIVAPNERMTLRRRFEAKIAGALKSDDSSVNTVIRKDGGRLRALINASLVTYQGEQALQILLTDITEKENLQRQLREAQKMEAVGTLAGGVAHDFNNLLQAILGYTQLLMMDIGSGEPGRHELSQIDKSAQRASELTQQLLTFSRRVESRQRPVDLNHEIKQVKLLLDRTIPKMIEIKLCLSTDLPAIYADPTQVEQVLMNLAVNARDAMPDGGSLIIETKTIDLAEETDSAFPGVSAGRYASLTVSDTGHGMDGKTAERIFEPFFTTKETGKGTGLGLAIVYGIIKSHGGHIQCWSEAGKGSVFQILLPATEMESAVAPEPAASFAVRGGAETVLVVDDEEQIRSLAAQILGRFGYKTFEALNGESALEIYKNNRDAIDLVLLDLIMPGMGGAKCLQELLRLDSSLPVIIVSGYSTPEVRVPRFQELSAGYIKKPYQVNELLEIVRKTLDSRKLFASVSKSY